MKNKSNINTWTVDYQKFKNMPYMYIPSSTCDFSGREQVKEKLHSSQKQLALNIRTIRNDDTLHLSNLQRQSQKDSQNSTFLIEIPQKLNYMD